ncbi:hypothetical protein [Rhizobium sp. G21]|uniref:hypothetical protein n=1 Tax=Rhizobium sp. G21 TaxID=2758439 RepID=UPI0028A98A96|nr:hypothetical protein [Rhizobium sp. G21]
MHDRGFQHAEAARNMRNDRGDIGGDRGGGDFQIARRSKGRQHLVQRGGDEGEVDRADRHLRQRQPHRRQLHAPGANAQRFAQHGAEHEVEDREDGEGRGQHADRARIELHHVAGVFGPQSHADRSQRRQSERDGHTAEQDDLGHGFAIEAPAGIEAVAHRSTRQRRHADIVADRQADERRQRGLAEFQRFAGVARRQPVAHGETEIGAGGEAQADRQMADRYRGERRKDFIERILPERSHEKVYRAEDGEDENGAREIFKKHGPPVS